jgi:hypothetical protein
VGGQRAADQPQGSDVEPAIFLLKRISAKALSSGKRESSVDGPITTLLPATGIPADSYLDFAFAFLLFFVADHTFDHNVAPTP